MAYHPEKPRTERPKTPTEKAAGQKKDDDDDIDDEKPEEGVVWYSRKEPYHARLKQLMGDGTFDPVATLQLKDFLKVHKEYKQFNRNSLRSAFNDTRNEFTSRAVVDSLKGLL
jgi:hypothetical protein